MVKRTLSKCINAYLDTIQFIHGIVLVTAGTILFTPAAIILCDHPWPLWYRAVIGVVIGVTGAFKLFASRSNDFLKLRAAAFYGSMIWVFLTGIETRFGLTLFCTYLFLAFALCEGFVYLRLRKHHEC